MANIPTNGTAELLRVLAQVTDGRIQMLPYHWNADTLAYEVATAHSSGVGEDVVVTNTVPVSGPLTDAQLRATPVPVSLAANTPDVSDRAARLLGHVTVDAAPTTSTTVADGANVTQGAKADAVWDGAAAAPTQQSIFKYLGAKLEAIRALLTGTLATTVSNFPATQAVSGTVTVIDSVPLSVSVSNLPATQPVSAAALPLPAGAATDGSLATLHTDLATLDADLKSEIGTVGTTPGAYTVLDRLNHICAKIDTASKTAATEATMQKVLGALSRPAAPKYSTLLHR